MNGIAVWLDDFTLKAFPGIADALSRQSVTIMRSFGRVPNPAVVGEVRDYRQVAVVGGRDFTELTARVELATTTLPMGVIAVLPEGGAERALALHGPGLIDVLPPRLSDPASRIVLMAQVPIVSTRQTRRVPPAAAPVAAPEGGRASAVQRTEGSSPVEVVVIASSTGGSFVLAEVLRAVDRRALPPVLLAQHLDAEFVTFFAKWLEDSSGLPTVLVSGPTPLRPATVHLPVGGMDLCVGADGLHAFTQPSSSRFVPCADVLIKTAADALGSRALGVVLSGMGADGAQGLAALARAGGQVFCQLPSTAAVASMPESALRMTPGAVALSPEGLSQAIVRPQEH